MVTELNTKDFAIKYAGKRITIPALGVEEARIVGYNKMNHLIVERYDGRGNSLEVINNVAITILVFHLSINKPKTKFNVSYSRISIRDIGEFSGAKLKTPIIPYPHICKSCRKPSRRCGKNVFCSNERCPTRHALMTSLGIVKIIRGSKTNPIEVLCPVCKKLSVNLVGRKTSKPHADCNAHGSFPFTYVINSWYKYNREGELRVIKYVGGKMKSIEGKEIWWTARG